MWVAILCMVLATLFVAEGRRIGGPQDFVFPILAWQFLGLHAFLSVVVLGLSATGIWSAPWAVFLVGHVILLGVFTLLVLATSAGKDEIDKAGENTRIKVTDWRLLVADIAAAREMVPKDHPDRSVALKAIGSIHEALRYSDPMSNPALEPVEMALRSAIAELVAAAGSARLAEIPDLADQIQIRLKDRNTRLKALK